jgi:holo-[acyl-carrier protein] synthase
LGKPEIILSGKVLAVFNEMGGKKVHVSLSHIKNTAIAYVIIEG